MQTLPQFKVLQRGEQPPDEGYHVLLVHRFSSDWRALVHDITSRVPPSAGKVCHLTGRNAFTGTPGRPCGPLIRWRPSAERRSCMYETTLEHGFTALKAARPSTRRVTGQSSSAYPGEMSRPGAKTEPDLFTLPGQKTEPAPLSSRPVLLPDDLVCSLRLLADAELERLQAAVVNEVARRGPPPRGRASDRTRRSVHQQPLDRVIARQFPSLRLSLPEKPAPSERPSGQG